MLNTGRMCLLALGLLAAPAALSAECSQYITSGADDEPASGTLIGSKTVSWSMRGSGFGWSFSYSESYEVGTYQMADGSVMELNCSDYTPHRTVLQ